MGVESANIGARSRALGHASDAERCSIVVSGIVQGVGFRPFVFNLATRLDLGGSVHNREGSVVIEVEGSSSALAAFIERLRADCPSLARIDRLDIKSVAPTGARAFEIQQSESADALAAGRCFPADAATCDACLGELFDPTDRRYLHPFINCTSCGPRLTIARDAPYDRERTTMASFPMCDACRAEYDDPSARRFHAQPIACPACGPRLVPRDADGRAVAEDPLAFAERLISSGQILALKGLGGFHLACDATNDAAVLRLRRAKHRDEKPFAIMVTGVATARELCHVSADEAALLRACRAPIVLLQRREDARIASAVAPGHPLLGVMLAYTPVHHLVLRALGRPLVMTSGNRADEPIAFEDHDALTRLHGIADGFIGHDRPIHARCDDSVARVLEDRSVVLRRSRGYAPEPLLLPLPCPRPLLALGGHMKNAFALGRGEHALMSHHLGDLADFSAYRSFRDAVTHYEQLFAFEPEVLVHDLHPEYATTAYALERAASSGVRLVGVQHHHAHVASCMAENRLRGPVIGVAFDGTGYGNDGSLWGGELLVADYRSFRRAAHLSAVPLLGGERAIREPWRMAFAHLHACGEAPDEFLKHVPPESLRVVQRMLDKRLSAPLTTSAGRLFDAVAALLGLHTKVTYEGQAAVALEALAIETDAEPYPFDVSLPEIDTRPLVRSVLAALRNGESPTRIASRFHTTLAHLIALACTRVRDESSIEDIVLTGGVFQNARLLHETRALLQRRGFNVHTQGKVPPNDGGIALGQLAIAAAQLSGDVS